MTQCERLAEYLHEGGTPTPMDAWLLLGIYRLSARIFDLRKAGMRISMEMVDVKNQFGETVRVAKYSKETP